ncbi:RagB/SusD family nutrient uptake outer membrane protein [Epilithonimonas arachidiradicis]|uniref:Starch-binding protein n=1 Tax=Epilithonimonas arachidiradicis TaxID=1617282 RepID=A0A420D7L2_9FLAO|nr:RagB/SusD family nutrient uptake outer membrane protein [Epilithonimonas arachidiradicis]RKE86749.1 putative outer membrane starch-binding protein [Epilithonimonas arachidiradicis]GGG62295.1 starch-binding protein [Epilithonimonas arachidiradicis]
MKKHKLLIAILSCTLSFTTVTSCNDFLDAENISNSNEDQQFDSVADSFTALIGVYNQIIGDDGYGQRLNLYYPQSADDFKTSGDYNCNDRRGLSTYGACTSNPDLNKPFLKLYSGIERANLVIKNIPKSPVYQTGSAADKALMDRYYGEALTLRAMFYYDLIKNWGDVPMQMVPSSDLESVYLPKTDRDVIYDKIIADLETAAQLVPWRSEASVSNTRFSKAAVKGLRARIALARAGYSLRRDPRIMAKGSNSEVYYKIAYDECKEIIEKGQHGLNANFEATFRALHDNTEDAAHEVIFAIGAYGGNAQTDSKIGYYNGMRHSDNSNWKSSGGINAIATYFYEFGKYDVRRDITVASMQINDANQAILATGVLCTDGKFRKSWTSVTGTAQNLAIDWPLLRYSDILLMFAEADNEINGMPSAQAIDAVRQVRNRAYAGNLGQSGTIPTDKAGFFNYIVHERLLEFGGEGLRKYDLIRWNLLATKIAETKQKLTDLLNGTGQYANVPSYLYYKASPYDRTKTAQAALQSVDIYVQPGTTREDVYYTPSVATTPTGYTRINWRVAVTADYISSPLKGYAQYFEANRKELFPIYDDIILSNYNLKQDYGY